MAIPRPRSIGVDDIPDIAYGCAVLGTGGGGAVDGAILSASRAIADHGEVGLLAPGDLRDDDVVVAMSVIGAPTVGLEMIASIDQSRRILDAVATRYGRPATAIMPIEIGGSNGVSPIAWAARAGLPLVDGDAMGRAFPEGQMTSLTIGGLRPEIVVFADVLGNVSVLEPVDAVWAERHCRALAVASGAAAMLADHVLTGAEVREHAIAGTVTTALAIGRALRGAPRPLDALVETLDAVRLIEGKIVDVERTTAGGFVRGTAEIEGTGSDAARVLRLEIQNENLLAIEDGEVLASVPDLITVVDSTTAAAIFTEHLAYGQRVAVLAWASHPVWRTPRGLEIAGPGAFGYDIVHRPVTAAATWAEDAR